MSRLAGVRVVVTRPTGRGAELGRLLEAEGATPIPCPTVRIEPPEDPARLEAVLEALDDYDWIAFTSRTAVEVVARTRCAAGDPPLGALARVACVGPATAAAVEELGAEVAFMPPEGTGASLGRTLPSPDGARVLVPCADRAGPALADALHARGAHVTEVVAYRTVPAAPGPACMAALRRGVEAITFTSPSTVAGFVSIGDEWRELTAGAIVATIGPTTSAAARASGLGTCVEAADRSAEGLVQALVEAWASRMPTEEARP